MAGPTSIANWTAMKSPLQSALKASLKDNRTQANKMVEDASSAAADAFRSANDNFLQTWQTVSTSTSTTIVRLISVALAGIQQKMLKDQLSTEKDIEKEKEDLIKEEYKIIKDNITDARKTWSDIYKPRENKWAKELNNQISKSHKPHYDSVTKTFDTASKALYESIKLHDNNTACYTKEGLDYMNLRANIAKAMYCSDAQSKGYLSEDIVKIKSDNNSLARLDRFASQGQNAKSQSASSVNIFSNAINQLQPNVSGAQNAYLAGLGNLTGTLVNLFGSINSISNNPIPILNA